MIAFTSPRGPTAGVVFALVGLLSLAACRSRDSSANDNMSKFKVNGDTGAAAPATVIDMSATPRRGDSTAAVSNPTGKADAASSDTLGSRAKDSTRGPRAGRPVGPPR